MPDIERPEKRKRSKDEVKLWQRRLDLAEAKLKKNGTSVRGKGKWESLMALYRGDHWKSGEGGSKKTFHRVTSNLAKSNIDALRPQLYFQNPKVKISLKNPDIDPASGLPVATIGDQKVDASKQIELIESIDNYYLGEMGVKKTMKRIINDALILPYGIGKLEWKIKTEMVEVVIERNQETQEPTKTEKHEAVLWQKPSFTHIQPWQFLWDADLDIFDIDLAKWVSEVKFMSLEDLKADPFMENLKDLGDPEFEVGEGVENRVTNDQTPEEFKRYKVYEIHDLKNNRLIVWVDGSKKFQRDEVSPYSEVEGSVYLALGFDLDVGSSFPLPMLKQIMSKVKVRNWILSSMANHIARFNRKYKIMKNSMDEAELEKFLRGDDGTIVQVSNMGGGPEPIKDAPVAVDMYNLEAILKREVTEEFGQSAFNRASREPGVAIFFRSLMPGRRFHRRASGWYWQCPRCGRGSLRGGLALSPSTARTAARVSARRDKPSSFEPEASKSCVHPQSLTGSTA